MTIPGALFSTKEPLGTLITTRSGFNTHLRPNGCVVPARLSSPRAHIAMLTYLRVCSASNVRDALPLNLI